MSWLIQKRKELILENSYYEDKINANHEMIKWIDNTLNNNKNGK